MNVTYKTKSLEKLCTDEREMRKRRGDIEKRLRLRINALETFATLGDVVENDPLGGDGYYTVEDTGPGAKGYHIDIYADDGETGNYSTCYRNVYVA